MSIIIVVEPSYQKSSWCGKITHGILKNAKLKKIECKTEQGDFISDKDDLIAIIGTTPTWIYNKITYFKSVTSAHIVLISDIPYDIDVSCVCSNIYESTKKALKYLKKCKKRKTALYGVNKASASDRIKVEAIGKVSDIYYNNGDLKKSFDEFYENIDVYDSVICTNDYAAISLIQNLKEIDKARLDNLFIISFGNTEAAKLYTPSITTVARNYLEFAKGVVDIYSLVQKNPQISSVKINVKSDFIVRDTTKCIPFDDEISDSFIKEETVDFYNDNEISDLVEFEKIIENSDDIDISIVKSLSEKEPLEKIAQNHFLSVNGIKYRINRLLTLSKIKNKNELIKVFKKYFM